MSDMTSNNADAQSPFVNFTSDQARQHLLLDIARTFKGVDTIVDAKIDAHAAQIAGHPDVKRIPARMKGEPRVPLYMEGEPGVGKTTLIRAAIIDFCKIVGLNFVENPPDDYQFTPNDFYYATVNLSGKTNTMDIGGLPSKGELRPQVGQDARRRSSDAGSWVLEQVSARSKMGAGMGGLQIAESDEYNNGPLRVRDVTLKGEADKVSLVVNSLIRQLMAESKTKGASLNLLQKEDSPLSDRLSIQVSVGTAGTRITTMVPQEVDAEAEYVAEMLPNRRFAMANKARFCLFNFDDVANASEAVRNVLLEVAQSNRYSGVMDIGNALVTFTGNMGAEDGTNTQSEQSDAEVTRVFKVRVRDTPKDWARRVATKYAEVGDCLFSAFIHKHGNEAGVFRDAIGDNRTERGIPKPNSRSLENALAKVLPFFIMAREGGVSPTVFQNEIEVMVKGTAGAHVAKKYKAFVMGMLTEAIPLADQMMETGKLDEAKFGKYCGANAKASEQDFTFRFGTAVADAFVHRIAFSDEARATGSDKKALASLIDQSTARMCVGLAAIEPGQMTYTLSRVMSRLGGIAKLGSHDGVEVKLEQDTINAMANGFARSVQAGNWHADMVESAKSDFISTVSGSNTTKKAKKASQP
ncbi:hypothetical protein [Paucibacter soli]|uniref:hypothetical protein n=1 Tax=Paucibacter soli TaxID=3133433 RepID=UPI0030B1F16C